MSVQLALIEGMKTKASLFHKFKGQCKICRFCGGRSLSTKTKLWSNENPPICYCVENDWCLEVDMESGRMIMANSGEIIECKGVE